jgi:hypothetical protein
MITILCVLIFLSVCAMLLTHQSFYTIPWLALLVILVAVMFLTSFVPATR